MGRKKHDFIAAMVVAVVLVVMMGTVPVNT